MTPPVFSVEVAIDSGHLKKQQQQQPQEFRPDGLV